MLQKEAAFTSFYSFLFKFRVSYIKYLSFFNQNLKRHASECNSSLDQDQDRSINSSIASCYSATEFQHNTIYCAHFEEQTL